MFLALPTKTVTQRTENILVVNFMCALFIFGYYTACYSANVPYRLYAGFAIYSCALVWVAELMETRQFPRVAQWLVYGAYVLTAMAVIAILARVGLIYLYHA